MASQNIIPVHIAFIPILIPPLLPLMNKMKFTEWLWNIISAFWMAILFVSSDYIAEIMEFVVSPLCRNMGIGKEMLERASQIARAFGCVQIEVACNQLRKDAHRFYLREGMQNCHFKFSKSLL